MNSTAGRATIVVDPERALTYRHNASRASVSWLLLALAACAARPVAAPAADEPRPSAAAGPSAPAAPTSDPPAPVTTGDRWLDLDLADHYLTGPGCAVERGGALWCWGDRASGQPDPPEFTRCRDLNGAPVTCSPPRRITGVRDARAVAVGDHQVCWIADSGRVRCVSLRGGEQSEIRGVAHATELALVGTHVCALETEGALRCWQSARRIDTALRDVVAFDMNFRYGCALQRSGIVTCWTFVSGYDEAPELIEDRIPARDARDIALDWDRVWAVAQDGRIRWASVWRTGVGLDAWHEFDRIPGAVEIVAGPYHMCVRTADDAAFCKGRNTHGQLGDGTTRRSDRFVRIPDLQARGLALGGLRTCARTPDAILCVGLDPDRNQRPPPTSAAPDQHTLPDLKARALAAHGDTTCAVDEGDVLRCWGSPLLTNAYEPPGTRDFGAHTAATTVRVADRVRGLHGLWSDESAVTWVGADGRLRRAARWRIQEPGFRPAERVARKGPDRPIRRLAGDGVACAIESHGTSDRLMCGPWPGALAPIAGLDGPVAVTVGARTICALDRRRQVACLPYSTIHDRLSPVPAVVPGLASPRALAAGGASICALGDDARVRCWTGATESPGRQGERRLSFVPQPPIDVGLTDVAAIAGNRDGHCSLDRAGAVRCWSFSQEKLVDQPTPQNVGEVVELVAGARHFCARERGGAVTCWGDEEHAQLGRIPANVHLRPTPLQFDEPGG